MDITRNMASELQKRISGSVIAPEDAGYDEARRTWNVTFEQKPALIVEVTGAKDVIEAVKFARENKMGIAVTATGHGPARAADDAMLIKTSRMTQVRVSSESRTAWIEAGTKWQRVLEEAQYEGLAPLMGSSTDVGAIGYTLGGGMGWLARKYGLSADSVNYFEVVTADGELRKVSRTENSELFWALCGGGGGLGVVTAMEVKLYPIKEIFGGNLIYPKEGAKEILERYREWVKTAPDELTTSLTLANFPDIPMVPEALRGKSVVMVRGAYCGPKEEGEKLIRPWLEWREPLVNMWGTMPFMEVDSISNDPKDPIPAFVTNVQFDEITDKVIDELIKRAFPENGMSPLLFCETYHTGGAISRPERGGNAYSHRNGAFILKMIGLTPTPEIRSHLLETVSLLKYHLRDHLLSNVYINFTEGDEKWHLSKDAFSDEAFSRLQKVKAKYDPENVFNHSVDITTEPAEILKLSK
ncbi:MAG TPA: FAD-binding oxidoreductase [Clostridiaceae bacterium]|nr:FAD-binding oxidoreductase [Clostridiaceae bacterium]